jgi:hypothetical protein
MELQFRLFLLQITIIIDHLPRSLPTALRNPRMAHQNLPTKHHQLVTDLQVMKLLNRLTMLRLPNMELLHTMLQSLHTILLSHLMILQFPVMEHPLHRFTMLQAMVAMEGLREIRILNSLIHKEISTKLLLMTIMLIIPILKDEKILLTTITITLSEVII